MYCTRTFWPIILELAFQRLALFRNVPCQWEMGAWETGGQDWFARSRPCPGLWAVVNVADRANKHEMGAPRCSPSGVLVGPSPKLECRVPQRDRTERARAHAHAHARTDSRASDVSGSRTCGETAEITNRPSSAIAPPTTPLGTLDCRWSETREKGERERKEKERKGDRVTCQAGGKMLYNKATTPVL